MYEYSGSSTTTSCQKLTSHDKLAKEDCMDAPNFSQTEELHCFLPESSFVLKKKYQGQISGENMSYMCQECARL
jgi:hypothetical protein